jgi:O-antigen biosynthesis protein
VLYHWRAIPGSVALDSTEKTYAHERAREAIREHYNRIGVDAEVTRGVGELHRTIYKLNEDTERLADRYERR